MNCEKKLGAYSFIGVVPLIGYGAYLLHESMHIGYVSDNYSSNRKFYKNPKIRNGIVIGVTTLNNLAVSSLYFGVTYFIIHSACKYSTAESLKLGSIVGGLLSILMSTFFVIDIYIRKESMKGKHLEYLEIDNSVYNSVKDLGCLHAILTLGVAPAIGYLEDCVVKDLRNAHVKIN